MCGYFCIGFIDFMLAGKKLTDFTYLFCPHEFKKNDYIILSNFNEAIDKTNLSEQIKFRSDEISKIENYFIKEINQRKSCCKKLSKYIAVFDYLNEALILCKSNHTLLNRLLVIEKC